jgi:hypothetical protein
VAEPKLLEVDEHDAGLSWVLDEPMQRASHALVDGGRVWLVDPVDVPEATERALGLGEPAAVVQLLDRHPRDCAALAQRLGVPHLRLPQTVPDSPFEVLTVVDVPRWREVGLWWPAKRALVVAETVGTGPFFRVGDRRAGIHIFLRLKPPGGLDRFDPEHLLPGHGASIHGGAATAVRDAYRRSRRDLPGVLAKLPRALISG